MGLHKLLFKELWYRRVNFVSSILAIMIAVATPIIFSNLISAYKRQRDEIFKAAFKEKEKLLRDAENRYRIATKKFGYNVLILPKDQNIEDFYADDYASKTIPQDYVDKLAHSGVLTVRHFLPSLKQKIRWPEGHRTIIIFGTSGEVPNAYARPREPMMTPVKKGTAVVGYYIHKNMKLKIGDKIMILGRRFAIAKLMPQRGNKDDITIWLNLKDAQEILNKPGRINAILALQCVCHGGDFSAVRSGILKALPDVQVLGIDVRKIKSRAEIRATAAKLTKQALKQELQARDEQIKTLQKFMNIISPLIILASALWVSFLAMNNVRARKYEIGLLIALGTKVRKILYLFLAKAFLLGVVGALIGYAASLTFGVLYGSVVSALFDIRLLLTVLIITSVLTIIASLPPAIIAITTQSADVLRTE